MRFDNGLDGSLSGLFCVVPPVAVPPMPVVVVPVVVAPPAAPVVGLRSSTGAPASLVVVLWHAVRSNAHSAQIRVFCMCPPDGVGWEPRITADHFASGPQAGSRTSLAAAVNRCLTRPSLETAANIPRPPISDA